jgi:hypothetical protein
MKAMACFAGGKGVFAAFFMKREPEALNNGQRCCKVSGFGFQVSDFSFEKPLPEPARTS